MRGPSSESGTTDDLDWFRMQFRRKNVLRFLGKKIDFGMILTWFGVHSECLVQQERNHAYQDLA